MRWHGYRSENRYQVFQCLTHTLGLEAVQWRVLDQAHRKRNLAEYEGELDVEDALVAALVRVCRPVAERVVALGPVPGGCGTEGRRVGQASVSTGESRWATAR